jgi:hypothetical protein
VTAISPAKVAAGAGDTTLTVDGTGFVSATAIEVGQTTEVTTFVSSTQVTAAIPAAQLATGALLPIIAVNGSSTSGAGPAVDLEVDNPAPTITGVAPTALLTGLSSATVVVTGTGFVSTTVVNVGTSARPTTYASATQVSVVLTAADLASIGTLALTAVNPTPGGGTSAVASLTVAAPTPTPVIWSVTPNQILVGSADTTIQVVGANFTADSVVQWNGTALATTYVNYYSGGFVYAVAPAALLTAAGTASITVNSPTATPAVSNAVSVSIVNPPAPTLTSISPASGPINTSTLVTLNGTGFTSASTVSFNGSNLAATYVNSGQLTVTVPATSIALPGNGSFTVTTPAPGGGTTAALTFTAYVPLLNNSMVYDPANGLFYLSVPSAAGAPYGNSVVPVDPATGALGTPIPVGSEPDQLAITSDGKYLWVGLDGASAVVQVDLTANLAGTPFTLGGNSGIYDPPGTALALAALPGSPNSVVVSSTNAALAIYDSGVVRGTPSTSYSYNSAYALQVDGARGEVYAGSLGTYNTYTYSATGLAPLATATNGTYASQTANEMQIAAGVLYTDFGTAYDAESGSLLGTFYSSGSTAATGSAVADTTLGSVFILENANSSYYSSSGPLIQVFDLANYTAATASTIPVSLTTNTYGETENASRLTRWGTNGLAFRTPAGLYSLRSNLVKDLSTVSADLSVTIAATGSTATGANTTYTATIADAGPADSTNVALTAQIPSSAVLVSATPSAGSCSTSNGALACDLGGIANGSSVTVAFVVEQLAPGSATMSAQVSGSETDPNLANNQATSTSTITGSAYNPAPVLASITPATVLAGSTDTTITVNGSGFASAATVLLNGAPLATTVATSGTQLTATVPAANLASLGWSAISVSNPAPGGGTSQSLPLSVFSVITLGVNHILYDPYSRNIMASVGSGSSSVAGNSIVAITPDTGSIGTPVAIGSQPTKMALSDDGQVLYAILAGSASVARYNMLTQQAEYSFAPGANAFGSGSGPFRDLAVQAGNEDTIVLDMGYTGGLALIVFDPTQQTASILGPETGIYSGTSPQFLDPNTLLIFNSDTWQTLDRYDVTAAGLGSLNTSTSSSTLNHFGSFLLNGGIAYADPGGVADPSTQPATQLGVFPSLPQNNASALQNVAPDTSLQQVFFLENTGTDSTYGSTVDGIVGYDSLTYLPSVVLPLDMPTIEGNTSYTTVDLIRWGQDGLAALTSGGHIYLLRGAAVVPQLLNQNTAATLASSSAPSIAHGASNTLLTLTGSNFVPGVAVTWNGSYRTTTIISPTQVTVAIPASDLAAAGTASLVATNPGAAASSALTITIN